MRKIETNYFKKFLPAILGITLYSATGCIVSVSANTIPVTQNGISNIQVVSSDINSSLIKTIDTTYSTPSSKAYSTPSSKTHPHDGPDSKKTLAEMNLPIYNPKTDATPKESIAIKETKFKFAEPLLVRPKTDTIVMHHVAIPNGDVSAAAIHRAHLQNGWAGIGYHYLIRKDGTIERGRPLATVGAHAYGENFHTVGICVAGNFNKEYLEPAQYNSLVKLIYNLCRIYNITPRDHTIVGHRDVNDTNCPGEYLYIRLPQIRTEVGNKIAWEQKMDRLFPNRKTTDVITASN